MKERLRGSRASIALRIVFFLISAVGIPLIAGPAGGKAPSKKLDDFSAAGPECRKQSKVDYISLDLVRNEAGETRCLAVLKICGATVEEWGPRGNLMDLHDDSCARLRSKLEGKLGTPLCCDPKPPSKARCDVRPNQGFQYVSGNSASLHQEPSSDSARLGEFPRGWRFVYRDVIERDGHIWYHAEPPGGRAGWISGDDLSCDRPPPLPPGKPVRLIDTGLGNVHEGWSPMTSAGNG